MKAKQNKQPHTASRREGERKSTETERVITTCMVCSTCNFHNGFPRKRSYCFGAWLRFVSKPHWAIFTIVLQECQIYVRIQNAHLTCTMQSLKLSLHVYCILKCDASVNQWSKWETSSYKWIASWTVNLLLEWKKCPPSCGTIWMHINMSPLFASQVRENMWLMYLIMTLLKNQFIHQVKI